MSSGAGGKRGGVCHTETVFPWQPVAKSWRSPCETLFVYTDIRKKKMLQSPVEAVMTLRLLFCDVDTVL